MYKYQKIYEIGSGDDSRLEDSSLWPINLQKNQEIFSKSEKELILLLLNERQHHLFDNWDSPGINDNLKHNFFKQVKLLHASYNLPGGLSAYLKNARTLLASSRSGENPLDGYVPEVPEGVVLEPLSPG